MPNSAHTMLQCTEIANTTISFSKSVVPSEELTRSAPQFYSN